MQNALFFKYGQDVIWSLPLLFQHENVLATMYNILNDYGIRAPKIHCFGCPSILWSGGRNPVMYERLDRTTLLKLFSYVYRHNAVPTVTFTSTQLTKEDLDDKYANFFLDIALEVKARFIVFSDMLRDYIKSKDPNATLVASVIKPALEFQGPNRKQELTVENETNYYNKLLKEYDIVVVRPEYSKGPLVENPNLIDDLSRIEILVNQFCMNNCPRVEQDYKFRSGVNWLKLPQNPEAGRFNCARDGFPKQLYYKDYLGHTEEQIKKLVDAGVRHVKLQGRSNKIYPSTMLLFMAVQMFNFDGAERHILQDFALDIYSESMQRQFNDVVFNRR